MSSIKYVLAILILLSTTMTQGSEISYSYVELNVSKSEAEFGTTEIDGDTIGLYGTLEISNHIYIAAGYATSEFDFDAEQDIVVLGAGIHNQLGESGSIYGQIMFVDVEVDIPGSLSDDDTGYSLTAGYRHMVNDIFEIFGDVSFIDVFEDTETGVAIGARAYFTQTFSTGLAYREAENSNGISASLRINF